MSIYQNLGGDSNVEEYEYGPGIIRVRFRGERRVYVYTDESTGSNNIAEMKRLADAGQGLNSYINRYVRKDYLRIENA